jgi:CxxC motif-containing protein (DUF1111 family)
MAARRSPLLPLLALCGLVVGCNEASGPVPDRAEAFPGGATTQFFLSGGNVYSLPLADLDPALQDAFFVGNSLFNQNWVTAPTSTTGRDGVGPTFNARSCSTCHFKDGRGRPPQGHGDPLVSMLQRISIPGEDAHGGPVGDPAYGLQIQPNAILGVPAEMSVAIAWDEIPGQYGDGEAYSLRRPIYELADFAFGDPAEDLQISGRVAPTVAGLGLLEAIDEATLLALADPDDADGDGISGRPNTVWEVATETMRMGRFGWKAEVATVREQSAGAFHGDMGLTSSLFPEQNCPEPQTECAAAPSGGEPEVEDARLADVDLYVRTLAQPTRPDYDEPEVLRGRDLFRDIGCASCHVESLQTGEVSDIPALASQAIRPLTDLLLHDMGEGLSDGRPIYAASATEWRTAPLWGIGRVSDVNGHEHFLHDGRARGFAEAILWHGGEAEAAKERFRTLSEDDRASLMRFLESL